MLLGGGGGGYSIKVYTGRPCPEVHPLADIYHFDRKCTPFVYPLLTNGAPFTYLV